MKKKNEINFSKFFFFELVHRLILTCIRSQIFSFSFRSSYGEVCSNSPLLLCCQEDYSRIAKALKYQQIQDCVCRQNFSFPEGML